MDKVAVRTEVLLRWRELAGGAGLPVPAVEDLRRIGAALDGWSAQGDETVAAWAPTIDFLLMQLKYGVNDPIGQLPAELVRPPGVAGLRPPGSAPTPPPPPPPPAPPQAPVVAASAETNRPQGKRENAASVAAPAGAGSRAAGATGSAPSTAVTNPVVARLLEWRSEQVAAGTMEEALPKESQLRGAVARARTEEAIRAMLSASLKHHASALAAIVGVGSGAAPATPAAPAQSGAHAAAPPPQLAAEAPPAVQERPAHATSPAVPQSAGTDLPLTHDDFAEFDFSVPSDTDLTVKVSASPRGGSTISWPAVETSDEVVVYRLVSSDEYLPWAPDKADLIAATNVLSSVDARPFLTSVRHLQVWVNTGATQAEALGAQPVVHARSTIVSPVEDVDIREDEGRVIGQWTAFDGTTRVRVYRIPIERAAQDNGNPQYEILTEQANLGGFVDAGAERGRRYLYQAIAQVSVEGVTRLAAPRSTQVLVSVVLVPVDDLRVTMNESDGSPEFDLRWTAPPAGRVHLYRTKEAPAAGIAESALPVAALGPAGLGEGERLSHPVAPFEAAEVGMTDVPWPREWNRAYFTPVTVVEGSARVGRTVSQTRTGRVLHPRVVERVNKQVLTFAWPAGAAAVLVYIGARGQEATDGLSGAPVEISADQYTRSGGLQFPGQLRPEGCSLHLVPVSYAGGQRILGGAATVQYPGLLRVHYDIAFDPAARTATVRLSSQLEVTRPPAFALVHNPERFPLSRSDGQALEVTPVGGPRQGARLIFPPVLSPATSDFAWIADIGARQGFLRLFVDLPPEAMRSVAVLDPAPARLIIGPPTGRRS